MKLRIVLLILSITLLTALWACNNSSEDSSVKRTTIESSDYQTNEVDETRPNGDNEIEPTTATGENETMQGPFVHALSREDIREFYNEHAENLHSIRDLAPLPTQTGYQWINIWIFDSEIVIRDTNNEPVILHAELQQQIELYFETIGFENSPQISIRNHFGRYPIVEFSFRLQHITIGVIYSPKYQDPNWEHLEGDWYIFSWPAPSPVIE